MQLMGHGRRPRLGLGQFPRSCRYAVILSVAKNPRIWFVAAPAFAFGKRYTATKTAIATRHMRASWVCHALLLGGLLFASAQAQTSPFTAPASNAPSSAAQLQKGIDLTRQGRFKEAIPFLQSVRDHAPGDYAAGFNLALCYLGDGDFKGAIAGLNELRKEGHNTAAVNNLLSQAYIGDGQTEAAFKALKAAAQQTPKDEKLYAFVADACTDHYAYNLGLRVVDLGLQNLPGSARMHYERAVFLARLDRFDEAKPEFALAARLAPGSDIAYLALVQERLYEDRLPEALSIAREGIKAGHRDYQMLSLLGTVLMHAGVTPGQPQFTEAREALEASVVAQPRYSTSQIALGKLYLMEGHAKDAVVHLEIGRRLEPRNPAVYTSLARAYRQLGDHAKAQESIAALARLLGEKSKADSP